MKQTCNIQKKKLPHRHAKKGFNLFWIENSIRVLLFLYVLHNFEQHICIIMYSAIFLSRAAAFCHQKFVSDNPMQIAWHIAWCLWQRQSPNEMPFVASTHLQIPSFVLYYANGLSQSQTKRQIFIQNDQFIWLNNIFSASHRFI